MNERKLNNEEVPADIAVDSSLPVLSVVAQQNINNLVNRRTKSIPSSYRPLIPTNTFNLAGKLRVKAPLELGNNLSADTPPTGICNQYAQDVSNEARSVFQILLSVLSAASSAVGRKYFLALSNMTIHCM